VFNFLKLSHNFFFILNLFSCIHLTNSLLNCNFCTDFSLKVKYSDFHKIYITIPNQSLDIYIYFNRPLLVLMCHRFSSVLGIYIYLCDQFSLTANWSFSKCLSQSFVYWLGWNPSVVKRTVHIFLTFACFGKKYMLIPCPDLIVQFKAAHWTILHIWFREQYHPFLITRTRKLNLTHMEKGCQRVPY
jgi:hypothetical protein